MNCFESITCRHRGEDLVFPHRIPGESRDPPGRRSSGCWVGPGFRRECGLLYLREGCRFQITACQVQFLAAAKRKPYVSGSPAQQ
jgi:hypothetical protein